MKHTPGKWLIGDKAYPGADVAFYALTPIHKNPKFIGRVYGNASFGRECHERDANLKRIVDCVNACDGVEDPRKISTLIKDAYALLTFLTNYPHQNAQDISGYVDALEKSLAKATGGKRS